MRAAHLRIGICKDSGQLAQAFALATKLRGEGPRRWAVKRLIEPRRVLGDARLVDLNAPERLVCAQLRSAVASTEE